MANSTSNLDVLVQSQASKEVTANALFDAASGAITYGRRQSTSSGLTWGYYGGNVTKSDGTLVQVANGTLSLTASATNYVVANKATGAVSASTATTNWNDTANYWRLYSVVTGTATVTSYTDTREIARFGGADGGLAAHVAAVDPHPGYTTPAEAADAAPVQSVAGKTGEVTLVKADVGLSNVDNTADADKPVSTATQTALDGKETAGAATAAVASHELAADPHPQYLTLAEGDARYKLLADINDIGVPGAAGFGVGICPVLPVGFMPLSGFDAPLSDNYGNYQYADGSVMVWVPAFFYKWGTGTNGLAINVVDIKPFDHYATVAAANAAGYALHRAFYDGGAVKTGVFVDKYQCSNNGGIASSLRNGNPLSSNAAHNPFAGLTGAPTNAYHGAIVAAKTRGANFFCNSRFIFAALAMLSYAHAQASTSTTYCAWYSASTTNFPKGCNNNALRDVNDTTVLYTSDGYSNAGKTGSANLFSRTTHNGQNCGVADLNGNMWEITPGLTSNGTNYYILKTAAAMKNVTSGNTLATDLWGATGIAALYDDLGTAYESAWETAANRVTYFGSASQVFSEATSGNAWNWAGLGGMLAAGDGGTNAFGSDGFWDYKPNEMCPISGGAWYSSSGAGVWTLYLNNARSASLATVGFRAALYL